MLRREDKFYIQILKDFIHGDKTTLVENIDFKIIIDYGKTQNTNGIVFYQCKDFIPKEYLASANSYYASEIYAYGIQTNLTRTITNKLKENEIDHFVIKGPVVSKYYPINALRTMGDSDIVVKEKDLAKACDIMLELGYKEENSEKEIAFFKDGKEVEIHTHLIYPSKKRSNEEIELCDRCWNYVKDNNLDETFHFMYLLLHLKKHLYGIGIGIRQFVDLALMMKNCQIDYAFIDQEFTKLNLLKFKNVTLSLISKWFDVGSQLVEISDEFYEEATLKILKNGVHGFDNQDNKLNDTFMSMSGKDNKLDGRGKGHYLSEMFFPKYEVMIKMEKYQFLKDRKYLLPIAWVYRFILSLINNKAFKQIKETLTNSFFLNSEMKKRQKERDNWGL